MYKYVHSMIPGAAVSTAPAFKPMPARLRLANHRQVPGTCANFPYIRFALPIRAPKCDNRSSSHVHFLDLCLSAGDPPAARPYARRVRKNQATSRRPRAHAHRTRHLQRHVERALLLQIFARASEAPAHAQPARAAGTGRERGHHRHRRRLGLRVQNRVAQPSQLHRAVSGRDHRRGRNPARHFHHGRKAGSSHGFAALRPDHG